MKKLLGIVFLGLLLSLSNSFADHTKKHTIVVTCEVRVGHIKGTNDIGPMDIYFNKETVGISWMGDISKSIALGEIKTTSRYHDMKRILSKYKTGESSENFSDYLNNHTPVDFIYYAMRNWKNVSKNDSTLMALSGKFDNEVQTKPLSAVIYLNRVNANGRMVLRMDYDKKIKFPISNYLDGKFFTLETYLLESCKLKEKKF